MVSFVCIAGAEEADKKAALVESSATLTELSKLPGTVSKDADKLASKASSAMITGKAETEAALAKATAQAEEVFAKSKDEGRAMLANAQSGLEAAQVSPASLQSSARQSIRATTHFSLFLLQAHMVAGGRDIVHRGEEIAQEAKRELGVAQKEVEKVEKKKGWFN